MIRVEKNRSERIQQGDIYRNIECIQKIEETEEDTFVHKIVFPLVIVLTQDCDLKLDSLYHMSNETFPKDDDKRLLSAIVAPIYNEELFLHGDHLNDETLSYKMQTIAKMKKGKLTTQYRNLINNEIPRFHYLEFQDDVQLVNSVIDFKHYFTTNIEELHKKRYQLFVCKVSELYRELISQRFANYLSRIGLPNA